MFDHVRVVRDADEMNALWVLQAGQALARGKIVSMGEYNACVQVSMKTDNAEKRDKLMGLAIAWEGANA